MPTTTLPGIRKRCRLESMNANINLHIADPANRYTLRAMIEAAGHTVLVDGALLEEHRDGDVLICDIPDIALRHALDLPTLLLTPYTALPEAIRAMEQGVYGYIQIPLQPGEAPIMVRRALEARDTLTAQAPSPTETLLTLAEAEKQHILHVLRACKHNQARTARILGIGRNTLWRKLRQYRDES